jgi:glycosyltransferase involved in cell wall biosynthesis
MPSRLNLYLDAECFIRPYGGIAKATWALYEAFCHKYSDEFNVVAIRRNQTLQNPLPEGMQDLPLGNFSVRDFWRSLVLPPLSWMPNVQAVHFPNNGRIPLGISNVPFPRKAFMTLHDVLPLEVEGYLEGKRRQRYIKRIQSEIEACAFVMTVSEYAKAQILRHFTPRNDIVVVPNASTLPKTHERVPLALSETQPYFLYTGRYEARKGIDTAIEAMVALHERNALSSQLWLTGRIKYFSQDFEALVKQATDLGIVKELGYVSDEALATLMHESRGLLYLSRSEGFGLPPLEAMTQGCPVVTTALTAIPEVCGQAVLYVDPDDLGQVQQAILQLEENAPLRMELIQKGLKQVQQFSWEASADRLALALREHFVH